MGACRFALGLGVAAVFGLSGCVMLEPPAPYQEKICGKVATMIPDGQDGCSGTGADGCAAFNGAHWIVRYSTLDPGVLIHEREHLCGMSHKEPWARLQSGLRCTEVTQSGSTDWRPGEIMCRRRSGGLYVERAPWIVEQTKKLQERSRATDPMAEVLAPDQPSAAAKRAEGAADK